MPPLPDGPARVLVLAGSAEAAELCALLADDLRIDVLASFAGRVRELRTMPCAVRVGGFGGVDGLTAELQATRCAALVDATHPFAAQMTAHAVAAADRADVPRLRLARAPWVPGPGDRWIEVADLAAAAQAVDHLQPAVTFLATGRHEVDAFAAVTATSYLLRSIDPPGPLPLGSVEVVLERGPFTVEHELALLRRHGVEAVVTRNSGGTGAAAKLTAARQLGLPVIVVRRPPPPAGPLVTTVDQAARWVLEQIDRIDEIDEIAGVARTDQAPGRG